MQTAQQLKDFSRYTFKTFLDDVTPEYDESAEIVGLDYNNGMIYAYIDANTLELVDAVTMFHNNMFDIPRWQLSMLRNKLNDFYRKL